MITGCLRHVLYETRSSLRIAVALFEGFDDF